MEKDQLIYPELSYQIIGILFEVHNRLGGSFQDKYYQRAVAATLREKGLDIKEQIYLPIQFISNQLGNYRPDFIIENKIILEIKRGDHFSRANIEQVIGYLKVAKLPLGVLANFTTKNLKYRRILNLY
ncbi:MAG: GxxExxY protein [Candidatus Parcubacteria bacterium]|nr:GxxExxY protein [Candidatus Parcubacteria bacterium]